MHHLGHTRSARRPDHFLLTPDTFVRAPLPGMVNANAIIHLSPAAGAQFTGYTAELDPGGKLGPAPSQRFLYVLEGEVWAGDCRLAANQYAYWNSNAAPVVSEAAARLAVIEKPYLPIAAHPAPAAFTGDAASVAPAPLSNGHGVAVQPLVPENPSFDFAVNLMTYQPGASLPRVDIHVMEHGLIMLQGEGIYRLGEFWYPVAAGDFIWMAPYCPQWYGALGTVPTRYLIYKDWNR